MIKRYTILEDDNFQEDENGYWCAATDALALQSEIERLAAENERLQGTIHQLVIDICELTDTDTIEAPYPEE